jgi:RNA polymerase sigma-70 factor (ECF subfamily)
MARQLPQEPSAPSRGAVELDPATALRLVAARSGDRHEFSNLTEPYRRELQLHCYRMLGSPQDAEDLVQETMLRAWRRIGTYEGRAPIRAWLYKIATNACLDELDRRPRRSLPQLTRPPADPGKPFVAPLGEPIWIEPLPDDLVAAPDSGPEAQYAMREGVTLAFVAALHALPPRQRAVLILRDVLDWSANETSELLDLTVPAVNSALHRARITLAKQYHRAGGREAVPPPGDRRDSLLDRYLRAWESADVAALTALLKEDISLSMPPSPSWYRGRQAVRAFLHTTIFGDALFASAANMRWRLSSTRANSQPAFASYLRDASGTYRAFGIQVLTFDGDQIADLTTFVNPALVPRFGLPDPLPAE